MNICKYSDTAEKNNNFKQQTFSLYGVCQANFAFSQFLFPQIWEGKNRWSNMKCTFSRNWTIDAIYSTHPHHLHYAGSWFGVTETGSSDYFTNRNANFPASFKTVSNFFCSHRKKQLFRGINYDDVLSIWRVNEKKNKKISFTTENRIIIYHNHSIHPWYLFQLFFCLSYSSSLVLWAPLFTIRKPKTTFYNGLRIIDPLIDKWLLVLLTLSFLFVFFIR